MANLIATIDTDRGRGHSTRYGSHRGQAHRLGDKWVQAEVANWNRRIEVRLYEDGSITLEVVDLLGRESEVLVVENSLEEFIQRFKVPESGKVMYKTRRGKRHRNRARPLDDILKEA